MMPVNSKSISKLLVASILQIQAFRKLKTMVKLYRMNFRLKTKRISARNRGNSFRISKSIFGNRIVLRESKTLINRLRWSLMIFMRKIKRRGYRANNCSIRVVAATNSRIHKITGWQISWSKNRISWAKRSRLVIQECRVLIWWLWIRSLTILITKYTNSTLPMSTPIQRNDHNQWWKLAEEDSRKYSNKAYLWIRRIADTAKVGKIKRSRTRALNASLAKRILQIALIPSINWTIR